jgi:MFS family permease
VTFRDEGFGVPTYAQVFRTPRYPAVFAVGALSMWGDYIARVTIAAVVYERTRSPLATATTLAVSLLPTVFGRSLLGPLVDRIPYKWVLIAAHILRAACVIGLIALVGATAPLWSIFVLLFVLEAIGGAATASSMVLMTDLFDDRRVYARAMGLNAMSEQLNQAVGLAVGGGLVALVGARTGLLIDFATFVIAASVISLVVQLRPVTGEPSKGLVGFVRDLRSAGSDLARHPVLARLVVLSVCSALAIVAPEALAIPLAGQGGWGGVLMAAPVAGAVVGIVLIGRQDVHRQNAAIIPLALAMPVPLLATAFGPPLPVLAALWFVSGMLQAFMVPLQATFTLVTSPAMRGRIFSLAGAVSVAAAGVFYLAAGWLGQWTSPSTGVAICAGVSLGLVAALGLHWPHGHVRDAVHSAYSPQRNAA